MTDTGSRFNHIDELVELSWGTIRVQCDIPKEDKSLEVNLRTSIRANASVAKGPQDRSVIETIIVQNYDDVRHLHVSCAVAGEHTRPTGSLESSPATS